MKLAIHNKVVETETKILRFSAQSGAHLKYE